MKRKWTAYLLLTPAVILFALAVVTPFLAVCRLSVFKSNLIQETFVGLGNFTAIVYDERWRKALVNSLVYVLLIVGGQVGIGLLIAMYAVNLRKWAQSYIRFVAYVPIFAAGIIIGAAWKWIWNYRYGIVNAGLRLLGIAPVMWLGHRWTALVVISVIIVCTAIGFHVVMFMATVLTISRDLYDAAKIDGASQGQIRRLIMLPHLTPMIFMLSTFSMIAAMQVWETIYVMTNGGPIGGTANLMYDVYATGIVGSRYGVASAKTIVLMAVMFGLAYAKRRAEKYVAGADA